MKATTSAVATSVAILPASMESRPRPGPTVRSSTMVSFAGKRAGAQQHRKVVCLLHGEAAGDLAGTARDRLQDARRRDHLVVEHDRHGPADVLGRGLAEALRAAQVEAEVDDRLAGARIEAGLRVGEVAALHHYAALDRNALAVRVLGGQQIGVGRSPARPACGIPASPSCRGSPSDAAGPAGRAPGPGSGRPPDAGCSVRSCRARRCGGAEPRWPGPRRGARAR